ncbi:transposase [Streptomyces sp. TSRI0281]|nr:transposase [Streptomyces sp. TSRI0281]
MPQSSVPVSVESNPDTPSCDCLAHVYGNAADHGERRRHYPSDMADEEWAEVRAAMPVPGWLEGRGGQPESYCRRQMVDAIRFLVDNGIKWWAMPVDFPVWHRVYAFFRRWRDKGLVKEFHDRLRGKTRAAACRAPEPTAGIVDSQSVKAAASVPASSRGFDGGKKINGRKRHIVVDTTGLLLTVMVTAANVTDREAAQDLLARLIRRFFLLRLVWADGGYTGPLVDYAAKALRLALTVAKRNADTSGFEVLPRRWVVERTCGWLMRSRRLARDYERRTNTSEAMVLWSMTMIMSRRLAKQRR